MFQVSGHSGAGCVHPVLSGPEKAEATADRQQLSALDQGTITNSWKEGGGVVGRGMRMFQPIFANTPM